MNYKQAQQTLYDNSLSSYKQLNTQLLITFLQNSLNATHKVDPFPDFPLLHQNNSHSMNLFDPKTALALQAQQFDSLYPLTKTPIFITTTTTPATTTTVTHDPNPLSWTLEVYGVIITISITLSGALAGLFFILRRFHPCCCTRCQPQDDAEDAEELQNL